MATKSMSSSSRRPNPKMGFPEEWRPGQRAIAFFNKSEWLATGVCWSVLNPLEVILCV